MNEPKDEWEYCQIRYTTYYNMGGGEHAGLNLGLLWFFAAAYGPNGRYEAAKSPETPFAREADGFPDKNNPSHLSLHQQLVDTLISDGWQPLSKRGTSWWQQRFRRRPREIKPSLFKRMLDYLLH